MKQEQIYLAGAIEASPDNGTKWRLDIEQELRDLQYRVFNPCTQADTKVFEKFFGNIKDGQPIDWPNIKKNHWDTFGKAMKEIVEVDLVHVTESDIVLVFWDKYVTRGAGTIGEITVAAYLKKPIYIWLDQDIQKTDLPGWIVGCTELIYLYKQSILEGLLWRRQILETTHKLYEQSQLKLFGGNY